jgi:endonuclease-3 related protein
VTLDAVLERLAAANDYPSWHWQPSSPPDYVCISAVLVQHTNWRNVERALERLGQADALSLAAIGALDEGRIAELVRPAGMPAVRARRLKALARLAADCGGLAHLLSSPDLRERLLATPGMGPETADAIALYAAEHPTFVIDAYTTRLFRRLGIGPSRNSYAAWQAWFEAALPRNTEAYRRWHALIVLHGKETCRPRPRCQSCCLLELCETGQASPVAAGPPMAAKGV